MKMFLSAFIKKHGPLKPITQEQSFHLQQDGHSKLIIAFVMSDVSYYNLPKEDRPSAAELKERGETKKNFSMSIAEGIPGYHFVNVERRYRVNKPMGLDLVVEVDDWGLLPDA